MQDRRADVVTTRPAASLDRLVVTHEHWDHLSGFLQARSDLRHASTVGEVWLAWTEDPHDELAQ